MKHLFLFSIYILSVHMFLCAPSFAETIFTYRAAEHDNDPRYDYDTSLLKLSLDMTVDEYGPYKLVPSPVMNFARAVHMAETNSYPNLILKLSYEERYDEQLIYAPVPVERGIVSYRVFFISNKKKDDISKIASLNEFKKLRMVQGKGWTDVSILEYNGFNVDVLSSYKSMFHYVAKGRADLFGRGANELFLEYQSYKHIENLDYDRSLILYYPLPRFFYTGENNSEAIERITLGLKKAWKNGSFIRLWEDEYRESIDFLNLKSRKIFRIENPNNAKLGHSYQQYFYDPLEEK